MTAECIYPQRARRTRSPLADEVRVVEATRDDWARLAPLHYRSHHLAGLDRLWAMQHGDDLVGIVVYALPPVNLAARNRALSALVARLPARGRARFWNRCLRTISRVVVDPNWRGLGLAARLVRETLPRAGVPYVEALAAMGRVHPFFERAGMTHYPTVPPPAGERMRQALATCGIGRREGRSAAALLAAVRAIADPRLRAWLEKEMARWSRSYLGAKTGETVRPTLEQTCGYLARFLWTTPAYFLWSNPELVGHVSHNS